jgi:hypothetical protein
MTELSGPIWVGRFPDSKTTAALDDSFRPGCEAFIAAMRAGGASVEISSTRRPEERAYLMFTCWRINKRTINPQNAAKDPAVDIDWVHRTASGDVDLDASRDAAAAMVRAYGIVFSPARRSMHTLGQAIDMTITWPGKLVVATKTGESVQITSTPRTGLNRDLRRVGATYGVVKNPSDPPHWSTTGA